MIKYQVAGQYIDASVGRTPEQTLRYMATGIAGPDLPAKLWKTKKGEICTGIEAEEAQLEVLEWMNENVVADGYLFMFEGGDLVLVKVDDEETK